MSFEQRLTELGLEIPVLPPPVASYVPAVRAGNFVFASGQTPTVAGALVVSGKLGTDLTVEQGQAAARLAAINCLAEVRSFLGSLDAVSRIVKLTGYVASAPGFGEQPAVGLSSLHRGESYA